MPIKHRKSNIINRPPNRIQIEKKRCAINIFDETSNFIYKQTQSYAKKNYGSPFFYYVCKCCDSINYQAYFKGDIKQFWGQYACEENHWE